MHVTVEYFARLREACGMARERLALPVDCSLESALHHLAARGGPLAALLLTADGAVSPTLTLAVNDRQVRPSESIILQDGDEVLLASPVSGG